MFEDDRGRLLQVEEWLSRIEEDLLSPSKMADEVLWWRLSMIEQCCARLTPAYLARHPEICGLELPTLDQVLNERSPPVPLSTALARRAIDVFSPLITNLPPPPCPRPSQPNPDSRFEFVVQKLQEMEGHLRSRGIAALYLFGSVARREDRPGSDVDVAFEIASDMELHFSLLDQSRIRHEFEQTLGSAVDLVDWKNLRDNTRRHADTDRVVIFD